jgi:hypothetical protein
VFSTIEDNHIHHIAIKREFYGYEIGGIKLHAAIDVTIRHNRIHDCSLGTWLDWQTQGTRITRNVYHDNNRDLFVEVSHGPYLVDHNVLGSRASFESFSQGGAFVNNLFGGTVRLEAVPDRATPYHRPHSTQVAGYAVIFGGDDRYLGNVFLGGDLAAAYGQGGENIGVAHHGLAGYDGFPAGFAEYLARIDAQPPGDHQRFLNVEQAVYARGNVYAAGARPFAGEDDPHVLGDATVTITGDGDAVWLETELPGGFDQARTGPVGGRDLERVRFADADFEEPDGSPAVIDVDLVGERRKAGETAAAGPVAALASGTGRTRIW